MMSSGKRFLQHPVALDEGEFTFVALGSGDG